MFACLRFLLLNCGMDKLFCSGRIMRFYLCERDRKGSPLVGVGECLCAHVQLCVLTKKTNMSVCVLLQGRAGLLCSPDKREIHKLAVLTCYPKAGTHL